MSRRQQLSVMAKWIILAISLLYLLQLTKGEMCSSGFISEEEVITESRLCTAEICIFDNGVPVIRLIPNMTFTCPGRIVKWRIAGRNPLIYASGYTVVRIWRESSLQSRSYDSTELTIDLTTCGENGTVNKVVSRVYECELTEEKEITVQAGDIVGLDMLHRRRLYFNSTQGPLNYEFPLETSNGTVSLSDALIIEEALPLLSLTVVPDSSTTEGITTTEGMRESTAVVLATVTIDLDSGSSTDNNTTTDDTDSQFNILSTGTITMIAGLTGLVVMPVIIITLTLALVCLLRKNRRLRRKMTQKQLGDGLNSSVEMMLSESREVSTCASSSCIPMEENIAYNKRKKSDDYDYVINELVYASIDERDQQPQVNVGSPDAYVTILEPTTVPHES